MARITLKDVHDMIGLSPDTPGYGTAFGPKSQALFEQFLKSGSRAPLTDVDIQKAADEINVPIGHIKGSIKVESPRGPWDANGRPTSLYERHVFARNCSPKGKFNKSNPDISGSPYGAGGYGKYSEQYPKLYKAMALDPDAALKAVSWGAFQVLGENAEAMGYLNVLEMIKDVVSSEAGHLRTYVRFIKANNLADKLRACKRGSPLSCVPFVKAYNGPGYAEFNYDVKFAAAI